jgi:hypothetical protein
MFFRDLAMKYTRIVVIILSLSSAWLPLCYGQDSIFLQARQKEMDEVFREKLHVNPDSLSPVLRESLALPGSSSKGAASSAEIVVSPTTPESEVHGAINPTDTNNIVVSDMLESGALAFPIYYTKDFGQTWKKSSFHPVPYKTGVSILGGGDPVLTFDADGKLYMSWINLYDIITSPDTTFIDMFWTSSTDGGVTWQRAANGYIGRSIRYIVGQSYVYSEIFDKEWLTVDRGNSPYRNTLYTVYTHYTRSNTPSIMVKRKLPGVDSMELPVQASSSGMAYTQASSIAVDAHGGVHVTYMGSLNNSTFSFYHAYSADGGATFEPQVKISDADIPNTSSDARGIGITGIRNGGGFPSPSFSIDTAVTGNLYMVWNAFGTSANEGNGANIYFSRSTDNGQNWDTAIIVNNDTVQNYTDHFQPSVAVDGQGTITVTWYDRRGDPSNLTGRYYMAKSTDQGVTWTNSPIASQPMNFRYVGNSNSGFGIGEYTQVLTTSSYTIPIWSDGRTNNGALHIYTEFIPNNSLSGVPNRIASVSEGIELLDNYPNPFSTETKLGFKIDTRVHAKLYITNMLGQMVATVFDGVADAGEHDFTLGAAKLGSGTYYCNLETDLGVVRKAMTVTR